MSEAVVVQGRHLQPDDIDRIRRLISSNPDWSRWRLSRALCVEWDWRNGTGQIKDMAARTMLLKLEALGLIHLPPRRRIPTNRMLDRVRVRCEWDARPIAGHLNELGRLTVQEVSMDGKARAQVAAALDEFHYLGCRGTVGENLRYTVTDETGRLLACLLFGAAAWKCRARDQFIDWTPEKRKQRLYLIANNSRFLILPFVRVKRLASWILGRVMRRLSADWEQRYGHPVVLAETFVERDRFAGTSYKAANWMRLGETTGRSRQDRHFRLHVPVKDVYVYPLRHGFRRELVS